MEAVQACSSEFLSFVASEARVKVRREGRSEVNEGDMLWALHALGFKRAPPPWLGSASM